MVASDLMVREGDGADRSGKSHDDDGHGKNNRLIWAATIAVATLAVAFAVLRRKR